MDIADIWRGEDWVKQARCKKSDIGMHLFFAPHEGADVEDDPYYARAKWVCSICPVRRECRDYADRAERGQKRLFGVIGGEDSFERRARREEEGKL